ncbi:hypothetical protein VTH06DRAFT_5847 [Thermothelomyces fergusii]
MELLNETNLPSDEDYVCFPHDSPKLPGPALRLSWPHAGDRKRAIVGKSMGPGVIHVSQQDMEMHYDLLARSAASNNGAKRDSEEDLESSRPVLQIPLAWCSANIRAGQQDLLQHFREAASRSLAVFGRDPAELGDVLLRTALAKNTAAARALFSSILALSSLHRHDIHSQAVEHKIAAIEALAAASGSPAIDTAEAMQHVAAGMLLCSFEIHQAACTSGDWTRYLRGVKHVIHVAGLNDVEHDADLAALLDWVYYHDVLARFSARHWHRDPKGRPCAAADVEAVTGSLRARPSKSAPPALHLIELLSSVCDVLSDGPPKSGQREDDAQAKSFLKILEWRIRTAPAGGGSGGGDEEAALVAEAYRLAMLVYLHRATAAEGPGGQGWAQTRQQWVERGYEILGRLRACDRQFPVFVLGCEARSDEQRAVVLDLIGRAETAVSSRSFNYARELIKAVWVQDDLAAREVAYWDKMSYVVSCCRNLPTFV